MLRLGKGHSVHTVAVLVGENDHDCLSLKEAIDFLWQTLHRRFIRDGALAGSDDDEEMIFLHLGCQSRQLFPVLHLNIFSPDTWVSVTNVATDELQCVLPAMENDSAFRIGGNAGEALQPTVETRFELGT